MTVTTTRSWIATPPNRRCRACRIAPAVLALAVDLATFTVTFTATVVVGRLLEIGV